MGYGFNNSEYVDKATISIEHGRFCFNYCCPNCETVWSAKLSLEQLALGTTLGCANKLADCESRVRMNFGGVPIVLAEDDADNTVDMSITDDLGGSLTLRLTNGESCSTPLTDIDWGRGSCGTQSSRHFILDDPFDLSVAS